MLIAYSFKHLVQRLTKVKHHINYYESTLQKDLPA